MENNQSVLLTKKQIAELLGLHENTIDNYIEQYERIRKWYLQDKNCPLDPSQIQKIRHSKLIQILRPILSVWYEFR